MLPMLDEHVIEDKDGNKDVANAGYSFIEYCLDSDEIDIFEVENYKTLIRFRWEGYAQFRFIVGFSFLLAYIVILSVYTYLIYVKDENYSDEDKD